jgi:putative oxidoreductase
MSMQPSLSLFLRPAAGDAPRAIVLLRAAVGFVFISSGSLKFLFDNQGPGRFAKIGLPPSVAYFVGAVEIVCGALVLFGLFARLASLPLVVDMIVAVVTTKLPLLAGAGPEPIGAPPKIGFLAFAYQARLDLTMLLGCACVAAVGAGAWSVDALLEKRRALRRVVERTRAEPRTA